MRGVYLPGNRVVEQRDVPDPTPGHGQVVVQVKASTICGSDIRAIYREHLGSGAEAYRGVIAGHEPCGVIVAVGPGCRRFGPGDRVIIYHIAGCGLCPDCQAGYMISCTSPLRAAYGWQRDGGHADYLLAEEQSCIPLPDELTFLDGACVACGFGTAYEALCRAQLSGRDALLVTGMGPVGMAVGLLGGRMGAPLRIGVDVVASRLDLALKLGAIDVAVPAGDDAVAAVLAATAGHGCEVSVDASGAGSARRTALLGTRRTGRAVLVGEGGRLEVDVSPVLIHPQLTVLGSWVTSRWRMAELAENLARWGLHPEVTVSGRYPLEEAAAAYGEADAGQDGKVAIVPGSQEN
ncbi:MAG TPA: zinc-binding dehydrogenase [Sporichthya sp.]|nr:zinc-binding dehydrogenase [Sporichthya sp.]